METRQKEKTKILKIKGKTKYQKKKMERKIK